MTGPIARILLRYIAGALVAKGILDPDSAALLNTDPDLIELATAAVGVLVGLGTEFFYRLARKMGWEL